MESQGGNYRELSHDARSVVSHTSVSSSGSTKSRLHSAKAKRLIAEHKLKKLAEKQVMERSRRDLDMKQRDLDMQQQMFEQQSEVEEAAIEESAW